MADVSTHSTLTTNLVSYWELEETSGTRVDAHGNNDLTDNNTVLSGTGKVGTCADFESSNSEYLSITDAAQTGLDITTAGSWAFWVNLESDTDPVVIDKTAAGTNSYWIQLRPSATQFRFSNSAEVAMNVTCSISLSTWTFLVVTYNAGTIEVFKDGVSQGTASNGTSLSNTTAPFTLGRVNKYTSNYLDGQLDQVGVWSKVLSGTEITDLYNGGAGLPYLDAGGSSPSSSLSSSVSSSPSSSPSPSSSVSASASSSPSASPSPSSSISASASASPSSSPSPSSSISASVSSSPSSSPSPSSSVSSSASSSPSSSPSNSTSPSPSSSPSSSVSSSPSSSPSTSPSSSASSSPSPSSSISSSTSSSVSSSPSPSTPAVAGLFYWDGDTWEPVQTTP